MNKSTIKKFLLIISICLCVCFLYGEYYIGCKVDNLIAWTSQVTLFNRIVTVGLIVSVVSIVFSFIKKFDKINIVLVIISIIIAGISIVSVPNWKSISDYQEKTISIDSEYFVSYTWEDVLEKMSIKNHYYAVYIGRESCKECMNFEKRIKKIANDEKITIGYYSTEQDRKKKEFDSNMEKIKVDSVPAIRIIGNGKIIKIDDSSYSNEDQLRKELIKNRKIILR